MSFFCGKYASWKKQYKIYLFIINLVLLSFGYIRGAWATVDATTERIDFGTIIQLNPSTASRTISANGAVTDAGVKNGDGGSSTYGRIRYTRSVGDLVGDPDSPTTTNVSGTISGCSYKVDTFAYDPSRLYFNLGDYDETLNVGATLTLSGGWCGETEVSENSCSFNITTAYRGWSGRTSITRSMGCHFKIVVPLSVENLQNLDFGSLMSPNQAGTVKISQDGAVAYSGISPVRTESTSVGQFKVTGNPSRTVYVNVPADVTLNCTTPDSCSGKTMLVNAFSVPSSVILGSSETDLGSYVFNVGATLNVGAGQQLGTYENDYTVTVSY